MVATSTYQLETSCCKPHALVWRINFLRDTVLVYVGPAQMKVLVKDTHTQTPGVVELKLYTNERYVQHTYSEFCCGEG